MAPATLTSMLPTCRQATLLVDALEDSRVPLLTRWGARFHLRYCGKCQTMRAQYRATVEALRTLSTSPTETGVDAFRAWRSGG